MSLSFTSLIRKLAPTHWPLQAKLLVGVAAALLLLCAMLLTAVISSTDKALQSTVIELASRLEAEARSVLTDPVYIDDATKIKARAQEISTGLSIRAVEVLNAKGVLLSNAGAIDAFNDVLDLRLSNKIDWAKDHTGLILSPVEINGATVGYIKLAVDLEKFAAGRAELVHRFGIFAAFATALAIAISFVLTAGLSRRVRRMTKVSQKIIGGDYSARIVDHQHDEIGSLGKALNSLSQTVSDRLSQLTSAQILQQTYLTEAREERARLHSLLDTITLGIVFIDNLGNPVYVNRAAQAIWSEGLPCLENASQDIPERELTLANGRLVRESCRRVFDDDIKLGCVWVFEDISAEKQAQKTINFLAQRDELTGLYNRRSLNETLASWINSAPEQPLALIYVDLDNFKFFNDLEGHDHGDRLLRDFASRLTSITRTTDVVARMGGDEFMVLIKDMSQADLSQWCDRLLALMGTSELTSSIGVACYPRDGNTVSTLVAASFQALLDAKRAGKNAWRQYQHKAELAKQHMDTLLWSDRINQALRTDGFEVFLQGIHHTDDCSIHHYEALIRLPDQTQDPSGVPRYFNPGEFIHHAEISGKITDIDRWMIAKVIGILAMEPLLKPIAVNVSAVTLSICDIPGYVKTLLQSYAVDPHRLHLELTETTALSDVAAAQASVRALQQLGCSVCLDDFGSGFASLAYLKHIDADYLKVDGQFIQNLHKDRENQVLLRAIVDIAQTASRLTVAEWVENEQILQMVREFKVELAQGYHLSKPTPVSVIIAQLQEREFGAVPALS